MALELHNSPLGLQAGPLKYDNLSVVLLMGYRSCIPLSGKALQQCAHMWRPFLVAFCSVYFGATNVII